MLAFSEALITAVHISIDGEPLGKGHWAGGPLYVLPWEPSLYLKGLHTIQVKVEVSGGQDVLLRCPVGAARRMFFFFSLLCLCRTRPAGHRCGSSISPWRPT